MYQLIVKGHFDSAHHLPGHPTCGTPHGHTFRVETRVSGKSLQPNMMLVDFQDVKGTWKKYDHRDLNAFFEYPTAENIARTIFEELDKIPSIDVEYVKVWESPDACCEVTADD